MSANTGGSDLMSQDRARTYNVVKDSWRRVKSLALHGKEEPDTQLKEYKLPGETSQQEIKNSSLKDENDMNNYKILARLKTNFKQIDGKHKSETAPILSSLASKTIKRQVTCNGRCKKTLPDMTFEEISLLGRNLTLSSSDIKSSSESSSTFRKEDTFVVTDRRRKTDRISSSEDLRLKKAMVLAKANARHAVRNWHGGFYPHSNSSNNNNFRTQNTGGKSYPSKAFIENTGSEIKNDRGEKIFFQWRESETSRSSRVPQVVRKLYEYKKKRLKHKQLNVENSRSAPNKKSYSDKILSEKLEIMKRSRTADIAFIDEKPNRNNVPHVRNRFPSSRGQRLKTRASLTVKNKDGFKSEKTDMNNEYLLTLTAMESGANERTSVTEDHSLEVSGKNVLFENANNLTGPNDVINDSLSSSSASFSSIPRLEKFASSDSKKLLSRKNAFAPRPPSPLECIKKTWEVPYEHKIKVLSVPKGKVSVSHRKGKGQKSSEIDVKYPNKKLLNSPIATKNMKKLYDPTSYLQTIQNSATQFQIQSEDEMLIQKIDTTNTQAINCNQPGLHDNSSRDKNLPSSGGNDQMFCSNLSPEITDCVTDACKTRNVTAHCINNNKSEQINERRSYKHYFQKDGVVMRAYTKENYDGHGKPQDFHSERRSPSGQENTECKGDTTTNVNINSDVSIRFVHVQPDHTTRDVVNKKTSPLFRAKSTGIFYNKKYERRNQGTRAIKIIKNSDSQSDRKDDVISDSSNSTAFHHIASDSLNKVKDATDEEEESNFFRNDIHVAGKEYELPADLVDKNSKQTSELELPKFDFKDQVLNSIDRESTKTKVRTRLRNQASNSDQIHEDVTASLTHIDHSFLNKSDKHGSINVTCDRERQFDTRINERKVQPRVMEQKHDNASVTSDGPERSPQGVGVSPATSQVNKNITTVEDKRKQAFGMKGSLSRLTTVRNNCSPEKTEICHNELTQNDLPQSVNGMDKKHLPFMGMTFSNQLTPENSGDILVINNSSHLEVVDKQVHHARHDYQSIANRVSTEMLKLELAELKSNDALKTQSLSINRYKNEPVIPQGDSQLLSDVPQNRNTGMNGVSPRKSKTLKNLPKNKMSKTKNNVRQETKDNFKETHRVTRNRQELKLDVSANSLSKIQERRTNSDSYGDTSITRSESIATEQIINDRIRTGAISTSELCESYSLVNSGELVIKDIIPLQLAAQGDNLEDNKLLCDITVASDFQKLEIRENNISNNGPLANTLWDNANCRSIDILSMNVQKQADILLKGEQEETELANISQTKQLEKSGGRDKNVSQNIQMRTKVHERKRQTVNMHTQNMAFGDMLKENRTQPAIGATLQMQSKFNNMQENKNVSNRDFVSKQMRTNINLENKDITGQISDMSNSENIIQQFSRPKTAGLSAYSKHQSDDLWSTKTGEDDDDDGDDQIQFIEGEQDFYKVFGYDEETAAILIATKVYPVSDSVGAYGKIGESGSYFSDTIEHDLYVGGSGYSIVATRDTTRDSDHSNINSYGGATYTSKHNQDIPDFTRNQSVPKWSDQKKPRTLKDITEKPFSKQTYDFPEGLYKSDNRYLNIYRKQRSTKPETVTAIVMEENPYLGKQPAVKNCLITHSKNLEYASQSEERGGNLEIVQISKGLNCNASGRECIQQKDSEAVLARSHFPPAKETLTLLGKPPDGHEHKVRRRLYSEADIMVNNLDISHTFTHFDHRSDGDLNLQPDKLIYTRDIALPLPSSIDSKSHVALRNQLATEKHISHTRHHRQINSHVAQFKKSNALQMSTLIEPRNSRPKDNREIKNAKFKELTKPSQIRNTEASTLLGQASVNPYLQATDRILSRVSDADISVYSRNNVSNITAAECKIQDSPGYKDNINSPLRRMSHPVDSTLKHTQNASSYYVSRPRKLEPIMQMSGVRQSQK